MASRRKPSTPNDSTCLTVRSALVQASPSRRSFLQSPDREYQRHRRGGTRLFPSLPHLQALAAIRAAAPFQVKAQPKTSSLGQIPIELSMELPNELPKALPKTVAKTKVKAKTTVELLLCGTASSWRLATCAPRRWWKRGLLARRRRGRWRFLAGRCVNAGAVVLVSRVLATQVHH